MLQWEQTHRNCNFPITTGLYFHLYLPEIPRGNVELNFPISFSTHLAIKFFPLLQTIVMQSQTRHMAGALKIEHLAHKFPWFQSSAMNFIISCYKDSDLTQISKELQHSWWEMCGHLTILITIWMSKQPNGNISYVWLVHCLSLTSHWHLLPF